MTLASRRSTKYWSAFFQASALYEPLPPRAASISSSFSQFEASDSTIQGM